MSSDFQGIIRDLRKQAQSTTPLDDQPPGTTYLSPYDKRKPPLDYIIIHNRSKHANNHAITDLKKAWPHLKTIQVVQDDRDKHAQADHVIRIQGSKAWSNFADFQQQFDELAKRVPALQTSKNKHKVGFYSVWSAQAEDAVWAKKVKENNFVWIGADPDLMDNLEKIPYKQLCEKLEIPTAKFYVIPKAATLDAMAQLAFEKAQALGSKTIFFKHQQGGGGRGTQKVLLENLSLKTIRAALEKIIDDTGGNPDGVYLEEGLDLEGAQLFQLELEIDGKEIAHGGRLVWFNPEFQKVLEVGLTDAAITQLIPPDVYEQCRAATSKIAAASGYNSRGTNEILLVKDKHGRFSWYGSELNRRIQVEHKALSELVIDSRGRTKNVSAEQVMRACGYPPPRAEDFRERGPAIIGHLRLLSCDITHKGSQYHGHLNIDGAVTPQGPDVQFATGPVFLDADPQIGRALFSATSWQDFCDQLLHFAQNFRFFGAETQKSTYFDFIAKLAADPKFRALNLACNETFSVLQNPTPEKGKAPQMVDFLTHTITPLIVEGYRPGQGIPDQAYPTPNQIRKFQQEMASLQAVATPATPFSEFIQDGNYLKFIHAQKINLARHGGGTMAVAPRDVQQSACDQESAALQKSCAQIAAKHFALSGIGFGYEVGGAQYQAGLMRGFDWWDVLLEGCLPNLPAHSLTRSAWMNGLELKPLAVQKFIFQIIHDEVARRYGFDPAYAPFGLWQPNNFHAGNHPKQDITTGIMLDAGLAVIPNWAWDPRFTDQQLSEWVQRQINLFKEKGLPLAQIRIKNPGQGINWTSDVIVNMVQIIRNKFQENGLDDPIIHIHNHEFDGAAARIAANVLTKCQAIAYRYLIVDSAPPGTSHNSNIVLSRALTMTDSEREHLHKYNAATLATLDLANRFNNQIATAHFLDPYSGMAGGTISSDFASARDLGIAPQDVNAAIRLGRAITQLGVAVTPYSEWIKQIGFAIWKDSNISPKTLEAVEKYINAGGKLNLPPAILVGLQAWETLLPRPAIIEKLLINHGLTLIPPPSPGEPPFDLEMERANLQKLLPGTAITDRVLATYLAFGSIGLKFLQQCDPKLEAKGPRNLTSLMDCPEFLHSEHKKAGDTFVINGEKITIAKLQRFADGKVEIEYEWNGQRIKVSATDPKLQLASGNVKPIKYIANDKLEYGSKMPGVVNQILVKVGDEVKVGQLLAITECMKMKYNIVATQAGKVSYIKTDILKEEFVANEVLVALQAPALTAGASANDTNTVQPVQVRASL